MIPETILIMAAAITNILPFAEDDSEIEIESARATYSKSCRLANGHCLTSLFSEPIHMFRDGEYVPIEPSIKRTADEA